MLSDQNLIFAQSDPGSMKRILKFACVILAHPVQSLPSLSEQQIVDCSGRYGNYGCQGGWCQSSWRYLRDAGGDESESAYPYTTLPRKMQVQRRKRCCNCYRIPWYPARKRERLDQRSCQCRTRICCHRCLSKQLPSIPKWSLLQRKLFFPSSQPRRSGRRIRIGRRTRLLLGQELLGNRMGSRRIHQDGPKHAKQLRYCLQTILPNCLSFWYVEMSRSLDTGEEDVWTNCTIVNEIYFFLMKFIFLNEIYFCSYCMLIHLRITLWGLENYISSISIAWIFRWDFALAYI